MNYLSIAGLTFGIALVAVLFIGLLSYVSQLVRNAYQLKVEIRADMENGLKKIEDELGKKSKWMRSELGDDVSKIRQSIEQDTSQRLRLIEDNLAKLSRELDNESRVERADVRTTLNQLRKRVSAIDVELSTLKDEAARRVVLGQKRREISGSSDEIGELPPDVLEVNFPDRTPVTSERSSDDSREDSHGEFQPGFHSGRSSVSGSGSSFGGGVRRVHLPEFADDKNEKKEASNGFSQSAGRRS